MSDKKISPKSRSRTAKRGPKQLHSVTDLRRAYESMGRLQILEGALSGSPYLDVGTLASLAQQQLGLGHVGNAADLLRAAEHLSFAALAPREFTESSTGLSTELSVALADELERLAMRAEQRWADSAARRSVVAGLYRRTMDQARRAFAIRSYRPALELARAAEALTHLSDGLPQSLPVVDDLTRRLAS